MMPSALSLAHAGPQVRTRLALGSAATDAGWADRHSRNFWCAWTAESDRAEFNRCLKPAGLLS